MNETHDLADRLETFPLDAQDAHARPLHLADELLVVGLQHFQIFEAHRGFHHAAARADALDRGLGRAVEVNQDLREHQFAQHHVVEQIQVGVVIQVGDDLVGVLVEHAREDRVLPDSAVLDHAADLAQADPRHELAVLAEPVVQQPDLHHRPVALHVLVEVLEIRIAVHLFQDGFEVQGAREVHSQGGLADSDGSGDADIAFREHESVSF